jgi:hypothetical protein
LAIRASRVRTHTPSHAAIAAFPSIFPGGVIAGDAAATASFDRIFLCTLTSEIARKVNLLLAKFEFSRTVGMGNVKLSDIARETGYSAERIRQLFDADRIPGARARMPHRMRRCQDGPELRQWMAEARTNKGKHTKPRSYKAVAINLESPELLKVTGKIVSGIKEFCEARQKALAAARKTVDGMTIIGDWLLLAQQHKHLNRDDWWGWLRSNFPKLTYANAKRCMRLSRQHGSTKPMTDRQALYQSRRFGDIGHKETNKLIGRISQP